MGSSRVADSAAAVADSAAAVADSLRVTVGWRRLAVEIYILLLLLGA